MNRLLLLIGDLRAWLAPVAADEQFIAALRQHGLERLHRFDFWEDSK